MIDIVTLVKVEDWSALYHNNDLVAETTSFDIEDVEEMVGGIAFYLKIKDCVDVDAVENYVMKVGGFPDNLDDVYALIGENE